MSASKRVLLGVFGIVVFAVFLAVVGFHLSVFVITAAGATPAVAWKATWCLFAPGVAWQVVVKIALDSMVKAVLRQVPAK